MPVFKGKDALGYYYRWGKYGRRYYFITSIGEKLAKSKAKRQGAAMWAHRKS